MIEPREISNTASKKKLREVQIEKDYIIGWFLRGISKNKILNEMLIFKGGTALRKIYFDDFRLSEDLDFTYAGDIMDTKEIKNEFTIVTDWIEIESKIKAEVENEITNSFGNYSFDLKYTGPLGGSDKSIKVDISENEILVNKTIHKEIRDEYSDSEKNCKILCYSIEEIISEKLRSLMQRTAPRDLYDIWFLIVQEGNKIEDYVSDFIKKANFKDINPKNFKSRIEEKKDKFKSSWENQLKNQMNDVPDFENVWRKLNFHFKKFEKGLK